MSTVNSTMIRRPAGGAKIARKIIRPWLQAPARALSASPGDALVSGASLMARARFRAPTAVGDFRARECFPASPVWCAGLGEQSFARIFALSCGCAQVLGPALGQPVSGSLRAMAGALPDAEVVPMRRILPRSADVTQGVDHTDWHRGSSSMSPFILTFPIARPSRLGVSR